MDAKLKTPQGQAAYRKRKWIVEAPNGWIKSVLGFRQFSLRGLEKVKVEFKLVCLALEPAPDVPFEESLKGFERRRRPRKPLIRRPNSQVVARFGRSNQKITDDSTTAPVKHQRNALPRRLLGQVALIHRR